MRVSCPALPGARGAHAGGNSAWRARRRAPSTPAAAVATVPRFPGSSSGAPDSHGGGDTARREERSARRAARADAAPPVLVGTTADGLTVAVGDDGAFWLTGPGGAVEASGHVTLSAGGGGAPRVAATTADGAGALVDALITWPSASPDTPAARLRVTLPATAGPWARGLSRGVVLEASAPRSTGRALEMAELRLDLAPAGHWYGGPHLMRQLWPCERAALETSALVPHDNGATGFGNLTPASWVTSTGLVVAADDACPYFHVGMNAPTLRRGGRGAARAATSADPGLAGGGAAGGRGGPPRRAWGVGVQNMTREYLPREARGVEAGAAGGGGARRRARADVGDGQLRLQARSTYKCPRVIHPLADWLHDWASGDGPAGGAASALADAVGGAAAALARGGGAAADEAASTLPPGDWLTVRAAVCTLGDPKTAALAALAPHTPPGRPPSRDVLEAPIWTTWARYFSRVTQADVLTYAREIVDRGLPRSVLEIDDRWQAAYGDLTFDRAKFPDPKGMVDQLKALGFKVRRERVAPGTLRPPNTATPTLTPTPPVQVTVWVHPFAEKNSAAYREGAPRGYFVGSTAPRAPWWSPSRWAPGLKLAREAGFFRWWNSAPVVALDVTNPAAVAWFVGRLRTLQAETGIAGFKFDAGEPCFLPSSPVFHAAGTARHPVDYTRLYVADVAGPFAGGVSEVRTGHRTQHLALLTRMGDRFSTWGVANGLRSLIPTLLVSGLAGYPYILPDMVGGNAYFGATPDGELMARWAQANALMPALQFSIPPWDCGDEATAAVAACLATRARFAPTLAALADVAAATLEPIARPLWWLDPRDPETHAVDDAFALGNDVVVAPVVDKGLTARDVYLPAGWWRDADAGGGGELIRGGAWVRGFPAPLSKLPVFVRAGSGAPGAGAAPP
jgi:hypothetical protein